MNFGLGMRLEPRQELELVQSMILYETAGDLELLSLHRIKNRMTSMNVHTTVRVKLISELFKENQEYQRVAKNKKMCITPTGLDNAVYNTRDYLIDQMNLGLATVDDRKIQEAAKNVMSKQVENQTGIIRTWFSKNYDQLIYDMEAKIPWPIIVRMRGKLSQWALGNTNPFNQPIEELIEETAVSVGLDPEDYDTPEQIWDKLKNYSR